MLALMALTIGGMSARGGPLSSTATSTSTSDAAGIPSCAGAPVEPGAGAVIDHIWVDPDLQGAWCAGSAARADAAASPATTSFTPTPIPSDAEGIPPCGDPPVEPGGGAIIDHIWVEP